MQPISVDPGPGNSINILFTTVTVCAPGSSANCQTIDHVVVDTASTGLRIVASVLSPALSLTQQLDAGNNAVAECAQFAGGYSWGPIKIADVKIAGEQASSVPIQIIGDPAFTTIPSACSSTGPAHNSVQTLLANGILGVGYFVQDCGNACVQSANAGFYYSCATAACQAIALPLSKQVQNPVARFANDNNGVIVQLPAIPDTGAATVTGALIFGIGTRSNNGLGNATVFPVNASTGTFTTVYKGQTLTRSFADSGSNALFFPDSTIPRCSTNTAFYCPGATLNLSGTIQGTNGTTATINFAIANTNAVLQTNPGASAFNNIGGPVGLPTAFDWGLPFFFGRNVYTAIVGASTPAGTGPYIAF
ncbi:MAG TPA: DUF3443 domain-containing protein [Burkholderiales bacterium]|nr:DUF3443 domain-containing protein [Burkholderiales bacterium]